MMTRVCKLSVRVRQYHDHRSVIVGVDSEALKDWCLGLSLLDQSLIPSIEIEAPGQAMHLVIQIDDRIADSDIGRIHRDTSTSGHLQISRTELESRLQFYLKACRDGFGDVDHLDVDLEGTDRAPGLFLTLTVPRALTPRSDGDELRGKLGLPPATSPD